jgi:hypothetical protein
MFEITFGSNRRLHLTIEPKNYQTNYFLRTDLLGKHVVQEFEVHFGLNTSYFWTTTELTREFRASKLKLLVVDAIKWNLTESGQYSAKSAYKH